jgi:hypothetical protein
MRPVVVGSILGWRSSQVAVEKAIVGMRSMMSGTSDGSRDSRGRRRIVHLW